MREQTPRSMIVLLTIMTGAACAQDHYGPGSANIRDWTIPTPGLYLGIYNYDYVTSRYNDASGNPINSVTITGPNGRSATINVGVNVNAYTLAPMIIWAPKMKKILGAKYAAYVNPSFTNASLSGLISAEIGAGRSASAAQFNAGDIFVQPVWLDWGGKHYDVSYGYGFYIPSGKYEITNVAVPVVGSVRIASPDNTGLGFWENQNQGALYLYPWADQRMAIESLLTWEINQHKRGFDLTPGQYLTWNWGVSQYLPLQKDQKLMLEVGPNGYNSYQITGDSGTDASNPSLRSHVDGAGLQVGLAWTARAMSVNFHWFREYSAAARFLGNSYSVNFGMKLTKD